MPSRAAMKAKFFKGVMMQKQFKQWMLLAALVPAFASAQSLQSHW
jgi:hypothetical protein